MTFESYSCKSLNLSNVITFLIQEQITEGLFASSLITSSMTFESYSYKSLNLSNVITCKSAKRISQNIKLRVVKTSPPLIFRLFSGSCTFVCPENLFLLIHTVALCNCHLRPCTPRTNMQLA